MVTITNKSQESLDQSLKRYDDFPYVPIQFSLSPLISFWESNSDGDSRDFKYIQDYLEKFFFLRHPIEDISVLDNHREFMETLVAPVFLTGGWTKAYGAICPPFINNPCAFATEPYLELHADYNEFKVTHSSAGNATIDTRLMYIYKGILKKFYDLDLKLDQPIVASCLDKRTELTRYFKLTADTRFVEMECLGELPDIDNLRLEQLVDKQFDPDDWSEVLPVDMFLFRGMAILTLIDVTIEEATNRLHYTLLNKGTSNESDWFATVESELRNVFRLPNLRLGVATIQGDGDLNFNSPRPLWNSLFIQQIEGKITDLIPGSFYEEVKNQKRTIIVEDLDEYDRTNTHPVIQAMIDAGYHNVFLTPLIRDDEIIGVLEMLNTEPTALNGLSLYKVNQIKPIFTNAIRRHAEEFENRVEAVMLEQFTSIHPKIQWKFRNAAIGILEDRHAEIADEGIVFHNLIPFYSSLDIRESSTKRNLAILNDLKDNLHEAQSVISSAHQLLQMAILEELDYQINQEIEILERDIASADAQVIAEFVRTRVNPVIRSLENQHHALHDAVTSYHAQLGPEAQIFIRHRLAYEQALGLINRQMIGYIQEQEDKMLGKFPCYIDAYQTDGLEYNIYLGQEVSPNLPYDPVIVDEVRLLQLQWTLSIMRIVDDLQPRMRDLLTFLDHSDDNTNCLQIAPLILVYGDSLTLKFRMNEKRLDVDGSYNVRYEIVKKRIDKATIKGTEERLTQPGHIAIIYTREEDAQAYIQHLEYLTSRHNLVSSWESFELTPMPGVEGLRALRVKVGAQGSP